MMSAQLITGLIISISSTTWKMSQEMVILVQLQMRPMNQWCRLLKKYDSSLQRKSGLVCTWTSLVVQCVDGSMMQAFSVELLEFLILSHRNTSINDLHSLATTANGMNPNGTLFSSVTRPTSFWVAMVKYGSSAQKIQHSFLST